MNKIVPMVADKEDKNNEAADESIDAEKVPLLDKKNHEEYK